MSDQAWTDDRVDRLKSLWNDGLSAAQVAKALGGVTRNAVIGKVHRLGLAGRVKPIGPAAAQGRRKDDLPAEVEVETLVVEEPTLPEPPAIVAHRPAPNFPLRPSPAPEPVALAVSERVTIMDLRDSMCRWPMGDPTSPEFRFCGARSITGLPYCTQHAQVAYQPAAECKRDRRVAGFR